METNKFTLLIPDTLVKMPKDLLHPSKEEEKHTHKLKRLVPYPNSYFMDVKCSGCMQITTVFSHAQTIVMCPSCSQKLCERKLTNTMLFRDSKYILY